MKNLSIKISFVCIFACIFALNLFAQATCSSLAYISGKQDEAIAVCSAEITKNPKNIEAYKLRGMIYFKMQNFAKAAADFDKVYSIDPEAVNGYDAAISHIRLYQKDSNESHLEPIYFYTLKALRSNPAFIANGEYEMLYYHVGKLMPALPQPQKEPIDWLKYGNHLINYEEYLTAQTVFDYATIADSKCTECPTNRDIATTKQQTAVAKKPIIIKPIATATATQTTATTKITTQQTQTKTTVVTQSNQSTALKPTTPDGYLELAKTSYKADKMREALAAINEYIRLKGTNVGLEYFAFRTEICEILSLDAEAAADRNKCWGSKCFEAAGRLFYELGDKDNTYQYLQAAVMSQELVDPDAALIEFIVKIKRKELKDATTSTNIAQAKTLANKGEELFITQILNTNNLESAMSNFIKALEFDQFNAKSLYYLGLIYEQQEDYAQFNANEEKMRTIGVNELNWTERKYLFEAKKAPTTNYTGSDQNSYAAWSNSSKAAGVKAKERKEFAKAIWEYTHALHFARYVTARQYAAESTIYYLMADAYISALLEKSDQKFDFRAALIAIGDVERMLKLNPQYLEKAYFLKSYIYQEAFNRTLKFYLVNEKNMTDEEKLKNYTLRKYLADCHIFANANYEKLEKK